VSKRHQSSRRRTYGRRQHELHERQDRRIERGNATFESHETDEPHFQVDPLAFLDPRTLRVRYGFGD
jgi:hypothetical protein